MTDTCLVVGAGQAALTFAQSLRERGYGGRIVIAGDEPFAPYQRPPLSKKFLAGEIGEDRLELKPAAFYGAQTIELRLGLRITSIDRARREAHHAGGTIAYDRLVLATGSRPRAVLVPGAQLPGVEMLRGIEDVHRLRALIAPGKRAVIVGGGYIGLEFAAVARTLGLAVTVIEAASRVKARVVAAEVATFFEELHRSHGVTLCLDTALAAIEPRGDGLAALTAGGGAHPADLVLIAVGAVPNVELARDCGVEIDNGIAVDAHARTSDPAILAIGDCASFPSARYGRRIRLESVQNAIDQAKAAAAALTGAPADYDPVPWFWSDQYDVKLQIAGLSQGHDRAIVRGERSSSGFSVFYFAQDRLLAVDSINRPRDHMLARRMIGRALRHPPHTLADLSFSWETAFD
jgi:3-phenylpropionate/trans-cinnamate dioxygenase ferredoxin reductase subunit